MAYTRARAETATRRTAQRFDYTDLLPLLFELNAGPFYVQLASEADQKKVLATIRGWLQAGQIVFVGVTDPINPTVETPKQVRDRVLEAESIPLKALAMTDDCGFSPFVGDTSTSREIASAKIKSGSDAAGVGGAQGVGTLSQVGAQKRGAKLGHRAHALAKNVPSVKTGSRIHRSALPALYHPQPARR